MFEEEMVIKKIEKNIAKLSMAPVISFDIFDTVLLRITNTAEDVFDFIGYKIGDDTFRGKRIESQINASIKASRNGKKDANLSEIYDELVVSAGYGNDKTKNLKSIELETEKELLYPNEIFIEYIKQLLSRNIRVVFTSDMYFNKTEICYLLDYFKVPRVDAYYISSEQNAAKYDNTLLQKVKQIESEYKLIHVGDNYLHDYYYPKKEKILTVYYDCKINNEHYKIGSNSPFSKIHNGMVRNRFIIGRKSFWYTIGFCVAAPIYLGLYIWLKNKLIKEKHNKIYFMARDGYMLNKLFNKYSSSIKSEYFECSRRSLLLPGITKLDEQNLALLPPYSYDQKVGDILEFLDFHVPEINKNKVVKSGSRFRKYYTENSQEFLELCRRERESINKYFNTLFIDDKKEKIAFFDTGWSGSSQFLLEKVLESTNRNIKTNFYYLGLFDNLKTDFQLKDKTYSTYLFDKTKNDEISKLFYSCVVIPELFFTAPHKSIKKYSNEGVPLVNDFDNVPNFYKDIERGIFDYFSIIMPIIEKYSLDISISDIIMPLNRLIKKPTLEEAKIIGNVSNYDSFAYSSKRKSFIGKKSIFSKIEESHPVFWEEGYKKRHFINYFKIMVNKSYRYLRMKLKQVVSIKSKITLKSILSYFKKYIKLSVTKSHNFWLKKRRTELKNKQKNQFDYQPKISVLIPVYNVKKKYLKECINSVINQTYKNWELCIVDDCSTYKYVKKYLTKMQKKSTKVKVVFRENNGNISKATNDCLSLATGDYCALLDCDDFIEKYALSIIVSVLNQNKDIDFIYSDEDKVSESGKKFYQPFFKPDWSPDTFMCLMYTCHLGVYRTKILHKIGGFRSQYDGVQDWDMVFRFTEETSKIYHIPEILYHWRAIPGSIAVSLNEKEYVHEKSRKLKEETLRRRGHNANLFFDIDTSQYVPKYLIDKSDLISIIIPTKNNYSILSRCIESIINKSAKVNYEIILIDNGSNLNEQNKYTNLCEKYKVLKYYYYDVPFNFSKINNYGVSKSNGNLLLFLNDDTEVISDDWLTTLSGHAKLNHIGAVGAKLLYPNSNILQHLGVISQGVGPGHCFFKYSDENVLFFGRNRLNWNVSSVTAACLAIEKKKFEMIGGFNEKLSVAYNDVDFCNKLLSFGFFNLLNNQIKIYHYESFTRGLDQLDEVKKKRLDSDLNTYLSYEHNKNYFDPFYNLNFVIYSTDYKVDFSKKNDYKILKNYKPFMSNLLISNYDYVRNKNNAIIINGWAFNKFIPSFFTKTNVILMSINKKIVIKTNIEKRNDLCNYFKSITKLLAGFKCFIELPKDMGEVLYVGLETRILGILLCRKIWRSDEIFKT